jgi:hypothetical protein
MPFKWSFITWLAPLSKPNNWSKKFYKALVVGFWAPLIKFPTANLQLLGKKLKWNY